MRESKGSQQFVAILRIGLITLCAVYLLGLTSYLSLRGVFGGRYWWLALLNDFAVVWFLPLPLILALGIRLRLRRIFIAGLCLMLVGGLWFGPYFLPKSSARAFGETLSVVGFNVWGDNSRLAEVEAWLRESNADMVLLQEVPPAYADQTLPGLADMYPYQVGQSTSERLWGNLFLSRYPILAVETLPGVGVPAQQRILVAYPGQHLAVYNVHLAMPISGSSWFPQLEGHFVLDVALSYDN